MPKPRGTIGWTLAVVLLVALVVTSFKALAEPAFNRHIAGSYRVVMLYQDPNGGVLELPHVATFTADGAVMSTFVPLRCGEQGEAAQSFTSGHGSWEIAMRKGRPVLLFNLLSDEWNTPVVLNADGSVKAEGAYAGPVQVVGEALLTTGVVKGRASIAFQGGCGKGPILVGFTAERIPAAADPKDNVSQ